MISCDPSSRIDPCCRNAPPRRTCEIGRAARRERAKQGMSRLRGELDGAALERALREIVRRHEVLRVRIVSEGGRPLQVLGEAGQVLSEVEDLSQLAEEEREAAAVAEASREQGRAFELSRGPLLRAKLLRLSEGDHMLIVSMHHIVSDGW